MQLKTIYLVICLIAGTYSESNTVIVFTDADSKGESLTINASDCVPNLPTGFDNSISSINTQGHCVNLYKDEGCAGDYIIIKPGNPAHGYLNQWENYNDAVSSIGPCFEDCDPRNIQTRPENMSTFITVFDHSNYEGHHATIDVKGCIDVPRKLKRRVSSIKSDDSICIEFHEHWNCTGTSMQLRKGTPFHNNLGYWGLNDNAGSVSLCGFRCNRKEQTVRNISSPGQDMITLYDEIDYNGNFKHFKVGTGCTNISDEWEGESHSIQTYGHCIIIYERFGCSTTELNLQLDKSNENSHRNLKSKNFLRAVRSIRFCPLETGHTSELGGSKEKDDSSNSGLYLVITFTVLGLFLIGLGIAAVIIIRLRRSHKRVVEILTDKEIEEFLRGCDNPALEHDNADLLSQNQPYDHNYEIPKEFLDIDMKCTLGIGEYAIVYKGHVRRPNLIEDRDVAVKTVKPYSGVEYVRSMLKEIKTMIYVGQHPRIVELVGCYTQNLQNAELFVMTELCENGSLEKFLQNNREGFVNIVEKGQIDLEKLAKDKDPVQKGNYANIVIELISSSHFNTIHLLQLSMQIAEGMEFLAQKKVIHGDLAARNVLLDSKFNVKISDFGLSRQLYEYTQYVKKHQAPLPWRWLAIESLKSMRFSTESDIWAFGITIWEIFTLCDLPYPGMVWGENFLSSLTDGLRLSKPTYATSDCYNLMISCWRERPSDRMSFQDLRFKFWEMLEQYSNAIYYSADNKEYIDLME